MGNPTSGQFGRVSDAGSPSSAIEKTLYFDKKMKPYLRAAPGTVQPPLAPGPSEPARGHRTVVDSKLHGNRNHRAGGRIPAQQLRPRYGVRGWRIVGEDRGAAYQQPSAICDWTGIGRRRAGAVPSLYRAARAGLAAAQVSRSRSMRDGFAVSTRVRFHAPAALDHRDSVPR